MNGDTDLCAASARTDQKNDTWEQIECGLRNYFLHHAPMIDRCFQTTDSIGRQTFERILRR